jgi:protein-tyrosine phosphatase
MAPPVVDPHQLPQAHRAAGRTPLTRSMRLREAFDLAADQWVEVACGGGTGRTGCALAVMAIWAGLTPRDAVAWVRTSYRQHAVETPWQRRWVQRVEP